MALIKNANSQRLLKEAIVLDMGDLARQAERILHNAQTQAKQILDRAQSEATQLIGAADERGFKSGFERGHAEGVASGEKSGEHKAFAQRGAEIDQLAMQWSAALKSWDQQRSAMLYEAREDILRFAIEVAKQVVHRAVQADVTIIANQLAAALALLSRPTAITVTIHPEDRALVEQTLPELLSKLNTAEHASITSDESITRGGCVVSTEGGRVDATIETQLQRIAEALAAADSPPQPPGKSSQTP